MSLEKKKAIGTIGSWYAKVDGELLPVVHRYWAQKMPSYYDPEARPGELQFGEFVEQMRNNGRVILQSDMEPFKNAEGKTVLMRHGYIAVFQVDVDSIRLDENGLAFRFLKRLCELQ
jgi:hypothetical protein